MFYKRPNRNKYNEKPLVHTCNRCQVEKPFTIEFYAKHNSKFKLAYVCKSCDKVRKANQLSNNRGRANERSKNWINHNKERGLCSKCSLVRLPNSNLFCETHYIRDAAWKNVHSKTKENGDALKQILEKQNYKCAYSGKKLILGVNASVDHIKSRALHPELAQNISNLQWVDIQVNRMKRELDEEDFLNLCKQIINHKQLS